MPYFAIKRWVQIDHKVAQFERNHYYFLQVNDLF